MILLTSPGDCTPKRLPAEIRSVKRSENGNVGRRFWGCQNFIKRDRTQCGLWLWEDIADRRAATAIANGLRREARPEHEEDCRRPPRPSEPSVTPVPFHDFELRFHEHIRKPTLMLLGVRRRRHTTTRWKERMTKEEWHIWQSQSHPGEVRPTT